MAVEKKKARNTWTAQQAQAKFDEVLKRARDRGPQAITRNGHRTAIVIAVKDSHRKGAPCGNLAVFLAESPLRDSGLQIRRNKRRLRKVDI